MPRLVLQETIVAEWTTDDGKKYKVVETVVLQDPQAASSSQPTLIPAVRGTASVPAQNQGPVLQPCTICQVPVKKKQNMYYCDPCWKSLSPFEQDQRWSEANRPSSPRLRSRSPRRR